MKHTNFAYCSGIDYDYERSGCTCNDYPCRCTTIEHTWINKITPSDVIKNIMPKKMTELEKYCFDRLCYINKIYDKDYYEINVCSGYYGEEIDSIYFENEEKVLEEFSNLQSLSDAKKILRILELEYGYVLKSIENARSVTITEVNKNDIVFPQEEYHCKLEKDVVESYSDYNLPRCVVIKQGFKYKIIDGYHRATACSKDKIKVVVVE